MNEQNEQFDAASAASATSALSKVLCQFSDAAREEKYQKSVWPEQSRSVRLALIVGVVSFLAGLVAEAFVLNDWPTRLDMIQLLATSHLGVVLFAALVAHASYAKEPNLRMSMGLVGFALAYVFAAVVVVKSGAIGWNEYAVAISLSVVFVAIFVPNRVPYTFASIGIIMVGYFGIIPFLSGVEASPRIVVVNLLIAVLCLVVVRRNATRARSDFSRLEELRSSRDEMVSDLGEAKFHREAFEQSAAESVTLMEEMTFLREDIEKNSSLMTAILDNISQGVCVFDGSLEMVAWNQGFEDLLGVPDELLRKGLPLRDLVAFNVSQTAVQNLQREKMTAEVLLEIVDTVLDQGECYSYERDRADGRIIEVTSHPMPDGGIVNTYTDITERKRAEQMARHMAEHDSLTGLANRAAFDAAMAKMYLEQEKSHTKSALVLLDLDGFKAVNDTYGHPVGDQLLCEVARIIRGAVRDMDIAARIGGDEFAIIFRNIGSSKDAEVPVERIISALAQPFRIEDHNIVIGVSAGMACCPVDGDDSETLIKKADDALYKAKGSGKGRLNIVAAHDAPAARREAG